MDLNQRGKKLNSRRMRSDTNEMETADLDFLDLDEIVKVKVNLFQQDGSFSTWLASARVCAP